MINLIIEGNIGSGKTTLAQLLKDTYPDCDVILEPVEKWRNIVDKEGNSLLHNFYQDQKRWSYTFQNAAFITRIQEMQKPQTATTRFVERSVFTDRNVFALNCYESGVMAEVEWNLYLSWFDWLVEEFKVKPNGYIYVKTDPDNCLKRIHKRDRCEETSVPLFYLQKIHNKHEDWLNNINTPVLILDGNVDFESDPKILDDYVNKIKKFSDELI
tara:strand:- start:65 stop:706 length:642 start_codon:yes stop_codon:yes gene_type:complete